MIIFLGLLRTRGIKTREKSFFDFQPSVRFIVLVRLSKICSGRYCPFFRPNWRAGPFKFEKPLQYSIAGWNIRKIKARFGIQFSTFCLIYGYHFGEFKAETTCGGYCPRTAQPFLGRLNIVGKQINEHRAMLDAAPSKKTSVISRRYKEDFCLR